MLVWPLRNYKDIACLMEELSAIYPKKVLHDMYEAAIRDQEYSFWYILLTAKKKENMFFVRFEDKLILD